MQIGSCTANAGVGLVEYFERRAFGKHLDASRLFLYKVTRNLLHLTEDTGAYLRTTMAAMALFGVPPKNTGPTLMSIPILISNPVLSVMPLGKAIKPSTTTVLIHRERQLRSY